jgi:hypothetical protein
MKFPARLLFALLLPLSAANGADAGLDTSHAWFKPALVENRSPICAAVLAEANRLFYSPQPQLDDLSIEIEGTEQIDAYRYHGFVTTHGKQIYLSMRVNPGCGSACETQQMFASAQPFEPPAWDDEAPGLSKPTPRAPALVLLKSQDDLYHVTLVAEGRLQLYTLTANAEWDGVCKVDIQPRVHPKSDSELQAVLRSVYDLQSTIDSIRQGAGNDCGSLKAHELGSENMRDFANRSECDG